MKFPLVALGLIFAVVFLAGCESLSDATGSVREKVAARQQPRTKVFVADPRATYAAARVASDRMGYRFLRGGAAQGELDAVSGLSSGNDLRSARQVSMKVRLHAALDGGTEVSVVLTEIIEADSSQRAGQGTSTPLIDTPQYEVFFRQVQQAIDAAKSG